MSINDDDIRARDPVEHAGPADFPPGLHGGGGDGGAR
jgi:hypothetical protein